jgi:hypothetical protein
MITMPPPGLIGDLGRAGCRRDRVLGSCGTLVALPPYLDGAPCCHEAVSVGIRAEPGRSGVDRDQDRGFVDVPDDLIERAGQAGTTDVEPAMSAISDGGRVVGVVLPIHLVIVGPWAIEAHWNSSPGDLDRAALGRRRLGVLFSMYCPDFFEA